MRFETVDLPRRYNLDVLEKYAQATFEDAGDVNAYIYEEIDHPYYNIDQFSLEVIMYLYFLKTTEQDLPSINIGTVFYLPIFLGLMGFLPDESEREALTRDSIDLIMNTAARAPENLFVLPLARIFRYFSVWPLTIKFPPNVIVLTIENYRPAQNVICVPYPSNYIYDTQNELLDAMRRKLAAPKLFKACFFGRKRGRDDHLRNRIISLIEESKLTESVSAFQSSGKLHRLSTDAAKKLDELKSASWISIEPPGDSPSRKGIFDSILSLTVPLLFDSGRYYYPFPRLFPWEHTCLFVDNAEEWRLTNGRRRLDDVIRAIKPTDIETAIHHMAHNAMWLQYTSPAKRRPEHNDAFAAINLELDQYLGAMQRHRADGASRT